MARLEREGDTIVFITSTRPGDGSIEILLEALAESRTVLSAKGSKDSIAKIDAGLRYLENNSPARLRDELRKRLQTGIDKCIGQEDKF